SSSPSLFTRRSAGSAWPAATSTRPGAAAGRRRSSCPFRGGGGAVGAEAEVSGVAAATAGDSQEAAAASAVAARAATGDGEASGVDPTALQRGGLRRHYGCDCPRGGRDVRADQGPPRAPRARTLRGRAGPCQGGLRAPRAPSP